MKIRITSVLVLAMVLVFFSSGVRMAAPAPASLSAFTVDDEMKMRAVVDVRIAPDGEHVAYVVSTPLLVKNEHQAALFVVPSRGGASTRLGEDRKSTRLNSSH